MDGMVYREVGKVPRVAGALICAVWLALGMMELVNPQGFPAIYGLEASGAAAMTLVQGIGARNAVIAGLGIAAAAYGRRVPLVAVFAALSALSALKFAVVLGAVGIAGTVRFAAFCAAFAGLAAWSGLSGRGEAPSHPGRAGNGTA